MQKSIFLSPTEINRFVHEQTVCTGLLFLYIIQRNFIACDLIKCMQRTDKIEKHLLLTNSYTLNYEIDIILGVISKQANVTSLS